MKVSVNPDTSLRGLAWLVEKQLVEFKREGKRFYPKVGQFQFEFPHATLFPYTDQGFESLDALGILQDSTGVAILCQNLPPPAPAAAAAAAVLPAPRTSVSLIPLWGPEKYGVWQGRVVDGVADLREYLLAHWSPTGGRLPMDGCSPIYCYVGFPHTAAKYNRTSQLQNTLRWSHSVTRADNLRRCLPEFQQIEQVRGITVAKFASKLVQKFADFFLVFFARKTSTWSVRSCAVIRYGHPQPSRCSWWDDV